MNMRKAVTITYMTCKLERSGLHVSFLLATQAHMELMIDIFLQTQFCIKLINQKLLMKIPLFLNI